MQSLFTEKEILGDALASEKAATEHYNTFANECVHDRVRDAIMNCLTEEHEIQQNVFNMMYTRGYYPTPTAQESKVKEAKETYAQSVKMQ